MLRSKVCHGFRLIRRSAIRRTIPGAKEPYSMQPYFRNRQSIRSRTTIELNVLSRSSWT
jgi:hypothetical protein